MSNINQLFKNHIFKDINEQFMASLSAILYLSNPIAEEFKLKQEIKMVVKDYIGGNSTDQIPYTIADILLIKLSENCRRIYAYNIATNKPKRQKFSDNIKHNNYEDLISQQNHIYQIISILKEKLYFGEMDEYENYERKFFTNAVLGQDTKCSSFEYLCYLGLHESLTPDNRQKHNQLIEYFQLNKPNQAYLSEKFVLNRLCLVIMNNNHRQIINTVFNCLNSSTLTSSIKKDASNSWNILALNYLFKNNIQIDKAYLHNILEVVMNKKILDLSYYPILVDNKKEFEQSLKDLLTQLGQSKLEKELNWSYQATDLCESKTAKLFYDIVEELKEPYIFLKVFKNNELSNEKKDLVFKLYDLNKEEIVMNIIEVIHNNYTREKNKEAILHSFMNDYYEYINKNVLSYIISLNVDYMLMCESIYIKMRIEDKMEKMCLPDKVKNKGKI